MCRDISKVSDLVSNISKEFALQNRTVPAYGAIEDKPTSDTSEKKAVAATIVDKFQPHLDDSLHEANFFLKNIGEWLVAFAKLHKSTLKRHDQAQSELQVQFQKVESTEFRCKQAE